MNDDDITIEPLGLWGAVVGFFAGVLTGACLWGIYLIAFYVLQLCGVQWELK